MRVLKRNASWQGRRDDDFKSRQFQDELSQFVQLAALLHLKIDPTDLLLAPCARDDSNDVPTRAHANSYGASHDNVVDVGDENGRAVLSREILGAPSVQVDSKNIQGE